MRCLALRVELCDAQEWKGMLFFKQGRFEAFGQGEGKGWANARKRRKLPKQRPRSPRPNRILAPYIKAEGGTLRLSPLP